MQLLVDGINAQDLPSYAERRSEMGRARRAGDDGDPGGRDPSHAARRHLRSTYSHGRTCRVVSRFVRAAAGARHQHGNRQGDRDLAALRSHGGSKTDQRPIWNPWAAPHPRDGHAQRSTREPGLDGTRHRDRRELPARQRVTR